MNEKELAMQLLGVASSLKLHGAFTSINGQDSSICQSVTFITLGFWLFRELSEQNYVRSIMSRLILKIQKFGTGM